MEVTKLEVTFKATTTPNENECLVVRDAMAERLRFLGNIPLKISEQYLPKEEAQATDVQMEFDPISHLYSVLVTYQLSHNVVQTITVQQETTMTITKEI